MKIKKFLYNCLILFVKKFSHRLYINVSSHRLYTNTPKYKRLDYYTKRIPRPTIIIIHLYFKNKFLKCAEIGVKIGLNAISIYNELNIKKLYLIDSWNNKRNYNKTLKLFKNKKNVIIIKGNSNKVVNQIKDKSLDFVYIDSNHSYKNVYQDISIWKNKVKDNGLIFGHDVQNNQVIKAVNDYCKINNLKYNIIFPDWFIKL